MATNTVELTGQKIEEWQLIAGGLLDLMKAKLVAITNRDTRGTLERDIALMGWLRTEAASSLQYAPSMDAVNVVLAYIEDKRYAPRFSDTLKRVSAAVQDGTTITAGPAPEGYTLAVWQWDFVRFSRVGSLEDHATPEAGTYVVVPESGSLLGAPSEFLEVSGGVKK